MLGLEQVGGLDRQGVARDAVKVQAGDAKAGADAMQTRLHLTLFLTGLSPLHLLFPGLPLDHWLVVIQEQGDGTHKHTTERPSATTSATPLASSFAFPGPGPQSSNMTPPKPPQLGTHQQPRPFKACAQSAICAIRTASINSLRAVFLRFVSHYAPPGRQPATVGLVGAIDAASLSLASAGLVCPAPFGHFSPRAFPVPSSFV
ncbi:hypothetical protein HYQ46_004542 [Verticillium longisporum]|nr:hypothetical protein HYQ46_004542 [Verticillium longisporum]